MTLGQWLPHFEALATPAQVQMLAQTLARQLTGEMPQFDAADAASYLQSLAEGRQAEFAALADRPLTDFIPVSELPVSDDRAVTWAGRHADSLAGYVAGTTGAHILGALPFVNPAAAYYRPTPERMERSLGRYEYQVYDRNPDPVERAAAFAVEHGEQIDWAATHRDAALAPLPGPVRETYRRLSEKVIAVNEDYRRLMDERDALVSSTSRLPAHDQNVAISDEEIRIDAAIDALERRIYATELEWQLAYYQGLMETARKHARPPSSGQEKAFATALARFETAARAELNYRDRLLANDKDATPNKRKSLEEAAYRALMHETPCLHDIVRAIFKKIGHPAADSLAAPLSFVWKEQAFRHAQGPADQVSAERLIETMIPFGKPIRDAHKGRADRESVDQIAIEWAIPLIADYFELFRLGAPAGLFNFSDIPTEARSIRGALSVFGGPSNPLRAMHLSENGVVTDQTHGDTMDYAAIFASRYLFWGRTRKRPSIVAESVFKHIPYMGPVIEVTTGGFLSRNNKQKREEFLNDTLPERLKEGRDVAQFGEGTRRLGNAFVSRYSNLGRPGALHAPGEFLSPGAMRGMQFRLALAAGVDVHLYAAKIHSSGSGEPSIPRSVKGFIAPHYTEFGYRPPKKQNGFVAYAGVIRREDMIVQEDFPGDPFHKILLRNVAINRRKLRRVGMTMDAGPGLR